MAPLSNSFLEQIECIFVDLGGVLFYDEYIELDFYYNVFTLLQGTPLRPSLETFFKARAVLYKEFKNTWVKIFLKEMLQPSQADLVISRSWQTTLNNLDSLFKPYEHALEILRMLNKIARVYCLANQPSQVISILSRLGYTQYFKGIYLDSLIGYTKPDLRLFKFGLTQAGTSASKVIHIGDRLDNDIIPALKIGITPIQLKFPLSPICLETIPSNFHSYFYESLKQTWHRWEESSEYIYISINSYEDLVKILNLQVTN